MTLLFDSEYFKTFRETSPKMLYIRFKIFDNLIFHAKEMSSILLFPEKKPRGILRNIRFEKMIMGFFPSMGLVLNECIILEVSIQN